MSVDDCALRDPRILRLARACGWSRRETVGALLDVWSICYDRGTYWLPRDDVDTAAERDGFAALLEQVGLAREEPEGLRIAGTTGRVEYTRRQEERGRKGGLTRAANAARARDAAQQEQLSPAAERSEDDDFQAYAAKQGAIRLKPLPIATATAMAKRECEKSAGRPADREPPEPAHALAAGAADVPGPVGESGEAENGAPRAKRARQRGTAGLSPARLVEARRVLDRLGRQNGVTYQGSEAHLRAISARLDDGCTEQQLRIIIAYCARPDGLGWAGDAKMARYLRPETLFGPENVQKYRDPALSWYRGLPAHEQRLGPLPRAAALDVGDDPLTARPVVESAGLGDLFDAISGG